MEMKKISSITSKLSVLLLAAASFLAAPSCIEDEYDLDKKIDETIELKNFTVALGEEFKVQAKDFLGKNWLLKIISLFGDWSYTFDFNGGEVGTFDIKGISKDLTTEYEFSHAIVTMTFESTLPCGFSVTAKALDANKNVIDNITATCEPSILPSGITEGVKVEIKSESGGKIDLDGVRLTLYSEQDKVKVKSSDYLKGSDIVVSFPDGIIKRDLSSL